MKRLLTIVANLLTAAALAAPTANEDFVLAEDAQTYTNAVRAAKDYTDAKVAAATPADYANVSNLATSAVQPAALAPYAKRTEIPSVPTNVSAFENDAGYLTGESDPEFTAWRTGAAIKAGKSASVGATGVAIGASSKANGLSSVAVGNAANASDYHSAAFGYGAYASGRMATAVGRLSIATNDHAVAIGSGASSHGDGTFSVSADNPSLFYLGNTNLQTFLDAALAPYAKRTEIPSVPTEVSAFENDAGYLTGESDPTVPAWAKAAKKPTYTASEVNAYTKAEADAAITSATSGLASVSSVASVSSALGDHIADDANPHGVTAAQVGALTPDEADATYYPKDEGDLWAAWWSGDGFRVTVTNYNVAPSADVPWARLPSAKFEYRPDGDATNELRVVWDEETKWARWRGEFAAATNDYRAALDAKAGLDWGATTPTGFDAPAGFTWLDTPATVISGGLAWQKTLTSEGAFWVLASNGMVAQFGAPGASTNGYFRITDERGNAVFEIVAGDKVTVGANAASVKTWTHTDGRTRLRVVYDVDSADAPKLYAVQSLNPGGTTDWKEVGTEGCAALAAGWTGQRGAWTNALWLATAPASAAGDSLFVCATYERGGDTVVKNHAAVSMEKLVLGGKTYTVGTATVSGHTVLTLTEVNQ